MRHITTALLATMFFICMGTIAHATSAQNKESNIKKPIAKADISKSTKAGKKVKAKKISKKVVAPKKVVLDMDKKSKKRTIAGKAIAQKPQNKKYWSVECKQGFIKDSYVYCARGLASVGPAKKMHGKKVAMKKAKQTIRK